MTDFRVFMKLLIVMMTVSLGAVAITTGLLYYDALQGREEILTQVAARYRRAITATGQQHEIHIVKSGKHPEGYVLDQLKKAIVRTAALSGFRGDIEIAVAVLEGDLMIFLTQRVRGKEPRTILMGSNIAIPMQMALKGKNGTIRSIDYNGDRVLAAYTKVEGFKLGIVAKSLTDDINFRFVKGSVTAVMPAIMLVILGAWFFHRTTRHIVEGLKEDNQKFQRMAKAMAKFNQGMLESEQRLKCFFDAAFEGITITENGLFIDSNKQFAEMYGYTIEELIGMPVADLVHPEDRARVQKNISESSEAYEHRSVHKDGTIIFVEVHGQVSEFDGRRVRITAIHDLAERIKKVAAIKELSERKVQSSKMEAIGNFAAGIAHDFNNALQPIIGNCELLTLKIDESSDVQAEKCRPNVSKILAAAETAQLLVRRIQTFTRKDDSGPLAIALRVDECIKESFEFLRSITPKTIDMDMQLEPNLSLISPTDVMIRQILMNLVKNAAHAIGDKPGNIYIDVSNEPILYERFGLTAGDYVKIEVEDDGCGMPEKVLEQALDPYYTTKSEEGTGLGLAVVHGILDSHNGLIHLQSEEGLGTKATIYVPALEGDVNVPDACGIDEPVVMGENQRILFVDDEENITAWAKDMLTLLQYEVIIFTDPEDAFKEFCINPTAYDVLMTDLTMPSMTGIELSRRVRKINPAIKIILSSGLGTNGKFKLEAYGDLVDAYMQKPITRREYARCLAEILELEEK